MTGYSAAGAGMCCKSRVSMPGVFGAFRVDPASGLSDEGEGGGHCGRVTVRKSWGPVLSMQA